MNQPEPRISTVSGKPCIRRIPIFDIYRKLAFVGMSGEEVLREHPGLVPEDLLAVREHVVAAIKARTHDEITGRPILAKEHLRDGAYYKGRCRNAMVARWNAKEQRFYHWREKFGRIFVETIKYPTVESEPYWDVFDVVEELPNPKFEIPFVSDAAFSGNPNDLMEYNEVMWHHATETA
jgi:uncharacterized protein (DUF433 family)